MKNKQIRFLFILYMVLGPMAHAQQLAFPTAEGFGRFATGGRGGEVYIVTNLNDDGEGSLRKGVVKHGPRIIVFAVSGTIALESTLDINNPDITIAGQSAPGDGICIKGYPVTVKANNVIIRYMRFRLGDVNKVEGDALGGRDTKDVIIDHCSISWATDENASFYRNENFTMQWCIISESLNSSVHSKGDHGYGGIWGGVNASFHHNLLASNHSRNPRFSGSKTTANTANEFVDFRNNVIYNWEDNSAYGGEKGTYNMINNYFKSGVSTKKTTRNRIVNPSEPYGKFYVNGNIVEGFPEITKDNWAGGIQCENPEETRLIEAIAIDNNVITQDAKLAFVKVLHDAGASLKRDSVDHKVVQSVATGKPHYKEGIIDSQNNIGGWPILKSKPTLKDTDADGMPDSWEEQRGLNSVINDADQNNLDEVYTNVEVYLNSLIPSHLQTSSIFNKDYHFVVDAAGNGDFTSVQDAIDAVPDFRKNETRIQIKSGVYKEKLVLAASKINVTLIGEDMETTILTYDDYAQRINRFGEEMGTTGSSSFFIFGDGFRAENISFQNTAGPIGQAVAVRIDGDKIVFKNCSFIGNQDTLYTHAALSRQYYENCIITGTVDFIFGWSTAVFNKCTLIVKDKGYITAASTPKDHAYGYVFIDCTIKGDGVATHYLGRPWRDYAKTVFINTITDASIKDEGWHNWNKPQAEKTTFYAEYNTMSSMKNSAQRVNWVKDLSKNDIDEYYTIDHILKGADNWNPLIKG